ncbi:hypothetical protein M404DRAFT_126893 [Pisolithus tinctorius Marx 270]|uniref:CCHC-type domain-containing protein n=1 Tax=Pisolithus tinctorius Marx 270 TaxID=870435 RepID=A0A0C3PS77_PISTI|nr:hypothetical protein M404DRAFT_126893 [Pisolithus tinctorius Marx 270]
MLFLNPLSTDTQKIQALANYLGTGSPAERWYDDLTATQRASWDDIVKAFNDRWPTTKSATLTLEEYQTELLDHKMAEEDVGAIKTVGHQKVWVHVKWVEEVMELARLAKIESGPTLIWQVKKQLPKAVRKLLDKEYTTWKKFTDDVKDLSMSKLKQEREEIEERKRKDEERDSRLMQKLEATKRATMADITAQLQRLTIGQVAVSHTSPRASPLMTHPNTQFTLQQTPRRNTPYNQPTKEVKEIVRKGLEQVPHHPDDEEGQRKYTAQLTAWITKHGDSVRVTEYTLYPLKPGTAMVCSGECFRCGTHGHGSRDCPTAEGDASRLSRCRNR